MEMKNILCNRVKELPVILEEIRFKSQIDISLSTCQRTRQNVFEYLLSNNLKIRKESPNSSLEEKEKA